MTSGLILLTRHLRAGASCPGSRSVRALIFREVTSGNTGRLHPGGCPLLGHVANDPRWAPAPSSNGRDHRGRRPLLAGSHQSRLGSEFRCRSGASRTQAQERAQAETCATNEVERGDVEERLVSRATAHLPARRLAPGGGAGGHRCGSSRVTRLLSVVRLILVGRFIFLIRSFSISIGKETTI